MTGGFGLERHRRALTRAPVTTPRTVAEVFARSATIVMGVSDEHAGAPAADPALVVVGGEPWSTDGDARASEVPELSLKVDDYLGDAYEPGRLTATVYEAVARAAALDGAARATPKR